MAVTPDERAAILDFLENYRKGNKTAAAPASVIDDNLTDKEIAYLKDSLERYRMRHKLIDNPEPKKQVSDEYIKAFEECIKDENKKRGKIKSLDEAYKKYQEKHKEVK